MTTTLLLGKKGEQLVVDYLREHGYTVLECNYRERTGEIDIIARKKEIIACVEVKLRTNHYFSLSEVIIVSKQKKIIKTAQLFLIKKKLHDVILRFDVALVQLNQEPTSITYLPNAFTENSL